MSDQNKDIEVNYKMKPFFVVDEVDPSKKVEWEQRNVVLSDGKGKVIAEFSNLTFPKFWSNSASKIVADKFLRVIPSLGRKETSVDEMLNRVVGWYSDTGAKCEYFDSVRERNTFFNELKYLLLNQYMSFNSPVWFNVGTTESRPPRVSACFILDVEDSMSSILNWYTEEGLVFKKGSGAGINLSKIRSSFEPLSSGGKASGPVSFMRGADASAGAIKSGGATRRAAKMCVLNVDHPDIEEFIECKSHEEKKARALRAAGFDMNLGGKDLYSIQYQNANNSVGLTNEFFKAYEKDKDWQLLGVRDKVVYKTVKARALMRKIAQAAWECADPGVFYLNNMNYWHTSPELGQIDATNPCGEFVRPPNTSCNLASLRLTKFYDPDSDKFLIDRFIEAVRTTITAMDISVSNAEYPTEKIKETVNNYRELGLGFTDLGALLMQMGIAYDSDEGRTLTALITALMTGVAYAQSARLSAGLGPYPGWALENNKKAHLEVIGKHIKALKSLKASCSASGLYNKSKLFAELHSVAMSYWIEAQINGTSYGFRNAQVTLIAPTGTISFMMDADTTGIEPDFSLVKFKKVVDGSLMKIVNQSVPIALKRLGYSEIEQYEIAKHIHDTGSAVRAPHLKREHVSVFDCAVGDNAISYHGHLKMMAAVQPFLSGAISKTINLPNNISVEEIEEIYVIGNEFGLKNLALYRDGCKAEQVLHTNINIDEDKGKDKPNVVSVKAQRVKLPKQRRGTTTSFNVDGCEGYIRTGEFPDGSLGEVFIDVSKQGSTLSGLMDVFAISVSLGLQHGVPLEAYVEKFISQKFAPAGMTTDPDFSIAQSLPDYIFRRLAADYLGEQTRHSIGVKTNKERVLELDTLQEYKELDSKQKLSDAPICNTCGVAMRAAGSCFCCEECGATSGCS